MMFDTTETTAVAVPDEGPGQDPLGEATASLKTTLTIKNAHLPFLRAAFEAAGWECGIVTEGITTDDGYDDEVKLEVKVTAPLTALARASPARFTDPDEGLLETVFDVGRLVSV